MQALVTGLLIGVFVTMRVELQHAQALANEMQKRNAELWARQEVVHSPPLPPDWAADAASARRTAERTALPSTDSACRDMPRWDNHHGMKCAQYEELSYCINGRPAEHWATGAKYNHPEKHCCACGKRVLDMEYAALAKSCKDTPDWHNQKGMTCARYEQHGYCVNGKAYKQWTLGEKYNYPEKNCCACGKSINTTKSCVDTPRWHNGVNLGCAQYEKLQYCVDGKPAASKLWTVGEKYNYPEKNCCVCGRKVSGAWMDASH